MPFLREEIRSIAVFGCINSALLGALTDLCPHVIVVHPDRTYLMPLVDTAYPDDGCYFVTGNPDDINWQQTPELTISAGPAHAEHEATGTELFMIQSNPERPLAISQACANSKVGRTLLESWGLQPREIGMSAHSIRLSGKAVNSAVFAVFQAADRTPECQTITTVYRNSSNDLTVQKTLPHGKPYQTIGPVSLHPFTSRWLSSPSIQDEVVQSFKTASVQSLESAFSPCRTWVDAVMHIAEDSHDKNHVPGSYLDAVWNNAFNEDGQVLFIDREWHWHRPIPVAVLFIRAAFIFLIRNSSLNEKLDTSTNNSMKRRIVEIADAVSVPVNKEDFKLWIEIEARLRVACFGGWYWKYRATLWLRMQNPQLYQSLRRAKRRVFDWR